eukprot:1565439-Rhodomonas_salina.1
MQLEDYLRRIHQTHPPHASAAASSSQPTPAPAAWGPTSTAGAPHPPHHIQGTHFSESSGSLPHTGPGGELHGNFEDRYDYGTSIPHLTPPPCVLPFLLLCSFSFPRDDHTIESKLSLSGLLCSICTTSPTQAPSHAHALRSLISLSALHARLRLRSAFTNTLISLPRMLGHRLEVGDLEAAASAVQRRRLLAHAPAAR